MRIALVIYGSLETISGGYLYDRILVDHLSAQGDLVEVVSLPETNYLGRLWQNFPPSLLRRLYEVEADLLIQDELCHPSLLRFNRREPESGRSPVVSIVHHLLSSEPGNPTLLNRLYRTLEIAYLKRVDGLIFNSETTRRAVERAIGSLPQFLVAQPGADRLQPSITDEQIEARAHQHGPLQVLFLGNVIPRKGLEVLIEALSRLDVSEWELTVVGSLEMDRDYTRKVLELTRKYGLEERVKFRGPLLDDQLSREMYGHQVMVMPSNYEGFGIAYLEAMGFGMPAVGTSNGAMPEILHHGEDGYLIPPGDSQALAGILHGLAHDRDRLAALGIQARKRYQLAPRWEASMEKIRSFLQSVTTR